ncbi:MAG TPA: ABC transporter permease [Terriglobia bacterium]|nr:ABC transporter permease [Terriglobia bacterium]
MDWLSDLFGKRRLEDKLDSEIRFHIEELTEAKIVAGIEPGEARRQAMLEFGGKEQIKEKLRDVHRLPLIETAAANVKSAFRFMRKSPLFSITVIATLALGIGANSAVFSALDAIVLRPLPFPESDRLMRLDQYNPKAPGQGGPVAPVRLEDWNRLNSTFQAMAGYYTQDESETSGDLPEKVTMAAVTPRFLEVWGVAPVLGRDFSPDEERFGGPAAVLISDRFWRRRFGGDPTVVGKKLHLSGYSQTIIGVMPASFLFPVRDVDVWTAIGMDAPFAQSRESTWFTTIGRLKRGVTVAQACANMASVQAQLGHQFPQTDGDLKVSVEPLKETVVGDVTESLWLLFGAVSVLLLIACVNIAALLLARASERQHEIAIRLALGATRAAVMSQLLTEVLVMALIGAALGLALAGGAAGVFRALAGNLPRFDEITLDWRIVLYTLTCAVLVALLCALFPALHATRRGLSGSLAQSSRTQVAGRNPLQWLLVGLQVALAVTLLTGAGLLLRSFQALGRVSPGFNPSHVLTLHITGGYGETADMKTLGHRIDRTLDALRVLPGVEAATTSATLPGVPAQYEVELKLAEGRAEARPKIMVESRYVSRDYFATMQIPLLAGKSCPEDPGTPAALVNRSFANAYFSGESVIGHHLVATENAFLGSGEIRGIVGDAREVGLNRAPVPTVYWCGSASGPDPNYLIRTRAEPMAMADTIRRKIHEVEPGRSVFDVMPLSDHLGDAFADTRLRTVLLTFFALTALSLACLGLYGTLSYFVSVRRREVGLRLALGAVPGRVLRQFLYEGLRVSLLGCASGLLLGAAFARVLSGMLYGVTPSDAPTLLGVVMVIIAVAAVASLVPAIRAARVEPMQVLREE